ncbi:unnamed protein product [Durusdinium trenchii]|uniref:Uncharacterized protein n=1 Tax=Durusdinium trenchii TaxID=1381693 RepID=A0ABP0KCW2_9DINO
MFLQASLQDASDQQQKAEQHLSTEDKEAATDASSSSSSLPAISQGPEARYSKEVLVKLLELHQQRMNVSDRWGSSGSVRMGSLAATCYGFTGGTCAYASCSSFRMAMCDAGKCMCPHGCAGADGRCYQSPNMVVASSFILTNVKYPKYRMYFKRVTTWGQMGTSSMPSFSFFGADLFDLYRVPGLFDGKALFMIASHKWPSYVLAIRATTGTALSPFGTYSVELKDTSAPWKPEDIMLRVCSMASYGKPNAIMIGSAGAVKTIWAYVHMGSWSVYGSMSSPGDGGGWMPNPPIPYAAIPPC